MCISDKLRGLKKLKANLILNVTSKAFRLQAFTVFNLMWVMCLAARNQWNQYIALKHVYRNIIKAQNKTSILEAP
jgi:hypothetical protein